MDRRIIAVGLGAAIITLLFSIYPSLQGTGFFSLGTETVEPEALEPATLEEKPNVRTALSLEILQPTTLEASISTEEPLRPCPLEVEAEIVVKNVGNSLAEKMFLEFGPGIKVNACSNCFLEELMPGQQITAEARLCLEETELNTVQVGSANSNAVELRFE